jgi:hypothetical protein
METRPTGAETQKPRERIITLAGLKAMLGFAATAMAGAKGAPTRRKRGQPRGGYKSDSRFGRRRTRGTKSQMRHEGLRRTGARFLCEPDRWREWVAKARNGRGGLGRGKGG